MKSRKNSSPAIPGFNLSQFSESDAGLRAGEAVEHFKKTGKITLLAPASQITPLPPKALLMPRHSQTTKSSSLLSPDTYHGLAHASIDVLDHMIKGSKYYTMPKLIGTSVAVDTYHRVKNAHHRGASATNTFVCGALGAATSTLMSTALHDSAFAAASAITISSGMMGLPVAAGLMTLSTPMIEKASHSAGNMVEETCQRLLRADTSPTNQPNLFSNPSFFTTTKTNRTLTLGGYEYINSPDEICFYRGDNTYQTSFDSSMLKKHGYTKTQDHLEHSSALVLKDLYEHHAISSKNSPFMSVTEDRAIAEKFAAGWGNKKGYVTTFCMDQSEYSSLVRRKKLISNVENSAFKHEKEHLYAVYIPERHVKSIKVIDYSKEKLPSTSRDALTNQTISPKLLPLSTSDVRVPNDTTIRRSSHSFFQPKITTQDQQQFISLTKRFEQ